MVCSVSAFALPYVCAAAIVLPDLTVVTGLCPVILHKRFPSVAPMVCVPLLLKLLGSRRPYRILGDFVEPTTQSRHSH